MASAFHCEEANGAITPPRFTKLNYRGLSRRRGPMTTLINIGVVYAALSVSLSIILVIGGWRANGSPQ